MKISSIVVRTRPKHLEAVKEALAGVDTCDVHFQDEEGRLVVTVEGDDLKDEAARLKEILALPHVVSADFSYTYSDDAGEDGDA